MEKFALFVFNGDPSCFIHVLLNALDLNQRGHEAVIVIEGAATQLVPDLSREGSPLHPLYRKAREKNLIYGTCKACSAKLDALQAAEEEGLALLDDMSGHPSMGRYLEGGYKIITF
jgi:hypothetical protein